jgi:hypothetical protein
MHGDSIEIRYFNPKIGYATEAFRDTGPQAAINAIHARTGSDTRILTMTARSAPSSGDRRDGGGPSDRRP